MDRWLLSFFIGAILSLFSPTVPVIFYKSLMLITFLMFLLVNKWRTPLAFVFGMLWVLFSAYQVENIWQRNDVEPQELWGKHHQLYIKVTEIVAAVETESGKAMITGEQTDSAIDKLKDKRRLAAKKNQTFYGKIVAFNGKALRYPVNVRLSVNPSNLHRNNIQLMQGNTIKLTAKLKPSHNFANKGAFGFKQWLLTKEIITTGYVNDKKELSIVNTNATIRQKLFEQYQSLIATQTLSPVLLALTFGERGQFDDEIWHVLSRTGTQHLIAISGLHIGLIASYSFIFLVLLVRLLPISFLPKILSVSPLGLARLQTLNIQPVIVALACVVALGYGYLANFSVPTSRALTMLCVVMLARYFRLNISLPRMVLLCACLLILLEPLSILSASFWLTFYAVGVIVFIMWRFQTLAGSQQAKTLVDKQRQRVKKYFVILVKIQLGITLLMLPMNILLFGQISLLSMVANLIAVPVVSLLVMPLLLCSLMLLPLSSSAAQWLSEAAIWVLSPTWQLLTFFAQQNSAVSSPSLVQQTMLIIAILLVVLFLLAPISLNGIAGKAKEIRLKFTTHVIPLLLSLASLAFVKFDQNEWQMHVLDVGQGLSVVLIKNSRAIIYDTGASYRSGFNFAESVVAPFVKRQGIDSIDYLFVSHKDNDHAGGLDVLLDEFPIKKVVFNEDNNSTFSSRESCLAGKDWQWQGLSIKAIHPTHFTGDSNDDSCVLLVTSEKHSVLLTGDISRRVEHQLVKQSSQENGDNALNIDVLVAPHHGSKTSSSKAFIRWASPKSVVFSAGFMNQWHMPNADVLARYEKAHVATYSTAASGTVSAEFSDAGLEILEYRLDIVPYWFAN